MGMGFLWGIMKIILKLHSVDGCNSEYSKNHWDVHFKEVSFMIYELYLRALLKITEELCFNTIFIILLLDLIVCQIENNIY